MTALKLAWHSLRTRFIILILVGFALTGAGAYFTFQQIVDQIVAELGTLFAEKQVLYDRERSLRPILREITIAQKLATSPTIIAWAKNEQDPTLAKRGLLELENFRQAFADRSYFFAIRSSGHYYYNDAAAQYTGRELRYTLNPSNPENRWFYETLNAIEPCLLNVDHDVKLQVTKLWMNCVVRDGAHPIGIVGSGIDLTSFIRDVIQVTRGDVVNIFIDQSGAIQAHRNPELIDFRSITKKDVERKKIFQLLDSGNERTEFAKVMEALKAGGEPVRTLFVDIQGHKYLAGLAYIREFGWYNVTLMGVGSNVTRAYFTPLAFAFAGALLVFLAIAGLVFKLLVLDRLARLDQSVRQVAAGNYDVQLHDDGGDEITRFTHEFQRMAATVRETTLGLEERVKARTAELTEANATKDRFFSIIAHDLRGPMGTVRNLTRELRSDAAPDATLVKSTQSSTEYAFNLLESLLLWASSHTGLRAPELARIQLQPELTIPLMGLRPMAEEKAQILETDIPEALAAMGDRDMVQTIVRNLVTNAIKFSPDGKTIRVSARLDGCTVRVAVQDQGVGISAETVARLFKLGQSKVSTPGTRKERGVGLGLILCKELAEKNGGDISVESSPGQGSTFTLTLPAAAP